MGTSKGGQHSNGGLKAGKVSAIMRIASGLSPNNKRGYPGYAALGGEAEHSVREKLTKVTGPTLVNA